MDVFPEVGAKSVLSHIDFHSNFIVDCRAQSLFVTMAKPSSTVFRGLSAGKEEDLNATYHFFSRDYTFASHGHQATELAAIFYKTTKVVKYEQELETLEVGTNLFSGIVKYLLDKRKNIVIWNRMNDVWEPSKKASPGNIVEVESLLPSTNTIYNPCIASLSFVIPDGNGIQSEQVGVCVVSTIQSAVVLYNSIETSNLAL